jgi:hypothetical protein
MNAGFIFVGLFVVMFLFLALYRARHTNAALMSQRMCPSCGLITSRSKPFCLECGKSLKAA